MIFNKNFVAQILEIERINGELNAETPCFLGFQNELLLQKTAILRVRG